MSKTLRDTEEKYLQQVSSLGSTCQELGERLLSQGEHFETVFANFVEEIRSKDISYKSLEEEQGKLKTKIERLERDYKKVKNNVHIKDNTVKKDKEEIKIKNEEISQLKKNSRDLKKKLTLLELKLKDRNETIRALMLKDKNEQLKTTEKLQNYMREITKKEHTTKMHLGGVEKKPVRLDALDQLQSVMEENKKMKFDVNRMMQDPKLDLNKTKNENNPNEEELFCVDIKEPVRNVLTYDIQNIHRIMAETMSSLKEHTFLSEAFYTSVPGYKCQFRIVLFANKLGYDFRIRKGVFDEKINWPFKMDIMLQVNTDVLNLNERVTIHTMKSTNMDWVHVCKPITDKGNVVYKSNNFVDVSKYIEHRDELLFDFVLM